MKTFSIAFVSSLLIITFFLPIPKISAQQSSVAEQELIALSTQWMEALERKDQATLERFLADEYYISEPGDLTKVERSEWLKNALEMDWSNLRFENFKVDLYGDTAVVTALLDFKVTTKSGIPIRTNSQATDIWVKRNGQWQVAGLTPMICYVALCKEADFISLKFCAFHQISKTRLGAQIVPFRLNLEQYHSRVVFLESLFQLI